MMSGMPNTIGGGMSSVQQQGGNMMGGGVHNMQQQGGNVMGGGMPSIQPILQQALYTSP